MRPSFRNISREKKRNPFLHWDNSCHSKRDETDRKGSFRLCGIPLSCKDQFGLMKLLVDVCRLHVPSFMKAATDKPRNRTCLVPIRARRSIVLESLLSLLPCSFVAESGAEILSKKVSQGLRGMLVQQERGSRESSGWDSREPNACVVLFLAVSCSPS